MAVDEDEDEDEDEDDEDDEEEAEAEAEYEENDTTLYCVCRRPFSTKDGAMIACDSCEEWCAGFSVHLNY